MSSRGWRPYVPAALMGAAAIALDPILTRGWLDLRSALLLSILLFALQLLRTVTALDRRELGRLVAFAAGSVALVAAFVAVGEHLSIYAIAGPVARLMLAWAFVLTLVPLPHEGRSTRRRTSMNIGMIAAAAAVFWLVCARATGGIRPYIVDEVLYLLQAAHAWHPPFMQPLDPHLARFFAIQQAYVHGGFFNGQYPPGWPLVLALFPGPVAHWLLLIGIQLALIVATYAFGRTVASRGTGLLAAALVSLNGMALYYSMSFFSEVFSATLLMTAGALLIAGFRMAHPRTQLGLWVAAGLLAGWAGATRPLTGVALWGAMVLFAVLLERPSTQRLVLAGIAMLAGAALPMAHLLWYNLMTTGSPFRFGYTLAEHGFQALGFGTRGFVRYGANGLPWMDVSGFGVHQAVVHSARGFRQMLAVFWPASLVLPLVFLVRHVGVRIRWRLVAPFALLPGAYFFYFYAGVRFLFELLPIAMVGTAWLLVRIADRRPGAAVAAAALMLVTSVAAIEPWLAPRANLAHTYGPAFQAIDRVRRQHTNVLVFVRELSPDPTKPFFTAMYAHNLQGAFHGPVVVARDLGAADTTLIAHYPGYAPFLLTNGTREAADTEDAAPRAYELVPLQDSVAQGDRTLLGYSCCTNPTR